MTFLKKVLPFKAFTIQAGLGLMLTTSLAFLFFGKEPTRAFFLGYCFYWANISALVYLGGLLVESVIGQKAEASRKSLRNLGMLMGALKFIGSIVVLFILINMLHLKIVPLLSGIFVAMLWTGVLISTYYYRYLNTQKRELAELQAQLKKDRHGSSITHPEPAVEVSFSTLIQHSHSVNRL